MIFLVIVACAAIASGCGLCLTADSSVSAFRLLLRLYSVVSYLQKCFGSL